MEAIRYDEPEFGFQWEELDSMTDLLSFEGQENVKPELASVDDVWGAEKPLRQLSAMMKRETSESGFNDVLLQVLQCPIPSTLNDFEDEPIVSELSPMTPPQPKMGLEFPVFGNPAAVQSPASNIEAVHEKEGSISAVSQDHLDSSPNKRSPPVPVLSKKERVCHVCGYEFMWPNRLRLHMRKHNDDKPLQCKNKGCDYRAKWNSGMAYHIKHHCKFNSPAPN
uniref:C2H2-type domain-containing protein n=1 Tax=Rhodosorus marinus TaxID=101924 RepID=A0A7S0G6K4_9RHOD|mmetsp:Transcript_3319/g.4774  ORF Transcript_3319/g.4774 Transcript_3319/m.4774 type:complete len:223 (+) Transcript_3319:54-722(+)